MQTVTHCFLYQTQISPSSLQGDIHPFLVRVSPGCTLGCVTDGRFMPLNVESQIPITTFLFLTFCSVLPLRAVFQYVFSFLWKGAGCKNKQRFSLITVPICALWGIILTCSYTMMIISDLRFVNLLLQYHHYMFYSCVCPQKLRLSHCVDSFQNTDENYIGKQGWYINSNWKHLG